MEGEEGKQEKDVSPIRPQKREKKRKKKRKKRTGQDYIIVSFFGLSLFNQTKRVYRLGVSLEQMLISLTLLTSGRLTERERQRERILM